MNYFEDFLNMIDSEHLNDLVKNTPGSDTTENAISEINKLIKCDEVLRDKIANCLALQQELWFNIGWSAGWSAGAVLILKLAKLDKPDATKIIKEINLEPG